MPRTLLIVVAIGLAACETGSGGSGFDADAVRRAFTPSPELRGPTADPEAYVDAARSVCGMTDAELQVAPDEVPLQDERVRVAPTEVLIEVGCPDRLDVRNDRVESRAEAGTPAVWHMDPARLPSPSDQSFVAMVQRLECNSGVTGEVLEPRIALSASEVVVTFAVVSEEDHGLTKTCVSNNLVAVTVDLGEPMGSREIIDGGCRLTEASTTSFCDPSMVRWVPS